MAAREARLRPTGRHRPLTACAAAWTGRAGQSHTRTTLMNSSIDLTSQEIESREDGDDERIPAIEIREYSCGCGIRCCACRRTFFSGPAPATRCLATYLPTWISSKATGLGCRVFGIRGPDRLQNTGKGLHWVNPNPRFEIDTHAPLSGLATLADGKLRATLRGRGAAGIESRGIRRQPKTIARCAAKPRQQPATLRQG